jgi:hypothetical protein
MMKELINKDMASHVKLEDKGPKMVPTLVKQDKPATNGNEKVPHPAGEGKH